MTLRVLDRPATSRPRGRAHKLLLGLTAALALPVLVAAPSGTTHANASGIDIQPPSNPNARPNIVLLVADDQTDWEMQWMPRTQRLLGDYGTSFSDAINPHPLCCPARAEILSGEYAQNNGVRHNRGPYGGYPRFASYDNGRNLTDNLAAWLHRSGYKTAFIGKMLNGYSPSSPVMDGWDYWAPLIRGVYSYYNFTMLVNGHRKSFSDKYVTDVLRNRALRRIKVWSRQDQPFFIWVSQVAPHRSGGHYPRSYYGSEGWHPPIPKPKDAKSYSDLDLPTKAKPSFNEEDISDKPSTIQGPPIDPQEETELFRQRVRSLQELDRANASIIRSLRRAGELDNTVVVYISDNGYLLGEHRLSGKNFPYDDELQIPMYWRGPGIRQGTVSSQTALTVDIAPTILQFAQILDQVRQGGRTDGSSLYDVLDQGGTLPTTTLIQGGTSIQDALDAFGWWWRGVRTSRYTYVRWWTGEEEVYDNSQDPYQLSNVVNDPRYTNVLVELRRRYNLLEACQGVDECQGQDFGPEPQPTVG